MPDTRSLLKVSAIGKQFPGVRALHNVDLTLTQGEVLSLVGENGAGKSTMMKILAGVYTPDEGTIELDGRMVRIKSVREAQDHGIALIHQELNLADNLDIAANIFLGNLVIKSKSSFCNLEAFRDMSIVFSKFFVFAFIHTNTVVCNAKYKLPFWVFINVNRNVSLFVHR